MKQLTIKAGNYGFSLKFYIYEADGKTKKDLSGLTPYWKVWKDGKLKFSRQCEAGTEDVNVVNCVVQEGDFDEEGDYYAEIELVGTSYREDTETFVIYVRRSV